MSFTYNEHAVYKKLEEQRLNMGVDGIEPKRLYNLAKSCLYRCNDVLIKIKKSDLINEFTNSNQSDFEQFIKTYIAEQIIDHTLRGSKFHKLAKQNYSWH